MLPATSPSVQGHTKREKERDDGVPSYHSSVQGHTRQEKERERERERERKRGAPSYETSVQGHTKEERGAEEESTEKLRLQQVPMNLETGFDRCGHLVPCRNGWLL